MASDIDSLETLMQQLLQRVSAQHMVDAAPHTSTAPAKSPFVRETTGAAPSGQGRNDDASVPTLPSAAELDAILGAAIRDLTSGFDDTEASAAVTEPHGAVNTAPVLDDEELDALTAQVLHIVVGDAEVLSLSGREDAIDADVSKAAATFRPERLPTGATADGGTNGDLLKLAQRVLHDFEATPEPSTRLQSVPAGARPAPSTAGAPADRPELKMVARATHNFHLNDLRLTDSVKRDWLHCFSQMSDDPRLLGWIAFQNTTVAASDHPYDESFVQTLADYRKATDSLRAKMGTLQNVRFQVDSDEGAMWFLPARDDIWLMLFAKDRDDVIEAMRDIPMLRTTPELVKL